MNYIDITKNSNTTCIKNNTIEIINREGIQGPAGKNGLTPYIDSETGNWCIGGLDTGVLAVGVAGKTPYINETGIWCIGDINTGIKSRGDDGLTPYIDPVSLNWFIGEKDTGICARAVDGLTPYIGDNGHWFIGSVDTGVSAGVKQEDVVELKMFNSLADFPLIGNTKNLYIDKSTNTMYRFDTEKLYVSFTPDYTKDVDSIVETMNNSDITIICGDSKEDDKYNI